MHFHRCVRRVLPVKDTPLVEWDYLPPIGPRPPTGFVGLKNAGATCYMNSVIQQLFMIDRIKVNLLAAEGAANDLNEDFSGEDRFDLDVSVFVTVILAIMQIIFIRVTFPEPD